jgi:hypothetical protein
VKGFFFSSRPRPERLWGRRSLLYSGYGGLLPRGWSCRGVKLTIHLHLVTRLRMRGAILPLPQYICRALYLFQHRDYFPYHILNRNLNKFCYIKFSMERVNGLKTVNRAIGAKISTFTYIEINLLFSVSKRCLISWFILFKDVARM